MRNTDFCDGINDRDALNIREWLFCPGPGKIEIVLSP